MDDDFSMDGFDTSGTDTGAADGGGLDIGGTDDFSADLDLSADSGTLDDTVGGIDTDGPSLDVPAADTDYGIEAADDGLDLDAELPEGGVSELPQTEDIELDEVPDGTVTGLEDGDEIIFEVTPESAAEFEDRDVVNIPDAAAEDSEITGLSVETFEDAVPDTQSDAIELHDGDVVNIRHDTDEYFEIPDVSAEEPETVGDVPITGDEQLQETDAVIGDDPDLPDTVDTGDDTILPDTVDTGDDIILPDTVDTTDDTDLPDEAVAFPEEISAPDAADETDFSDDTDEFEYFVIPGTLSDQTNVIQEGSEPFDTQEEAETFDDREAPESFDTQESAEPSDIQEPAEPSDIQEPAEPSDVPEEGVSGLPYVREYDHFETIKLVEDPEFYETGQYFEQGVNEYGFEGTCGPTSQANAVNTLLGNNELTENKVLGMALDNGLCTVCDDPEQCGATKTWEFMALYDKVNESVGGKLDIELFEKDTALSTEEMAQKLEEGSVLNVAVDSATLWGENGHIPGQLAEDEYTDHWITVTGVDRAEDGSVRGFNVVDSGGGVDYVDAATYQRMCFGEEGREMLDPTCIVVSKKENNEVKS